MVVGEMRLKWRSYRAPALLVLLLVAILVVFGTRRQQRNAPAVPNILDPRNYRFIRLDDDELAAMVAKLELAWKATASAATAPMEKARDVVSGVPPRTVCADFEAETGVGPDVRTRVSTWSEVLALCEADLRAHPKPGRWWTIAWHGDVPKERSDRDEDDEGVLLPPTILHPTEGWEAVPPSVSPLAVDQIIRKLKDPFMAPSRGPSTPEEIKEIEHSERVALAKLLLLIHENLRPGDTIQLFVCHLGKPGYDGKVPIGLVRRLAALAPGVRIIVYDDAVRWDGKSGKHSGPPRSVYVSPPIAP